MRIRQTVEIVCLVLIVLLVGSVFIEVVDEINTRGLKEILESAWCGENGCD